MQVQVQNVIRFERRPGSTTRVIVESYEARSRRKVSEIPIDFRQDQIRALVEDMCQVAGLPRPW
jgi:hypothetical protein